MELSLELQARGFINQSSGESLSVIFDEEKRVVYHGIDPTADSAHAGNFVVWMMLKHLVNHGHQVVFLVGGGTGMIGDPKPDAERVLQDLNEVERRVEKIKIQAQKFLGEENVSFVNNYDWLSTLSLITFLRDIGKHFTINELLKKDAIAKRVASETGISYTEFAYPLLQAYDYLQLYREKNCTLQVGGSDQWGNIVSGVDLIRRVEKATVFGVTVPLIVDKVTGKKFGKSEGNAVWLDAEKTTPYMFYQFWLQVADENVIEYLKLFTLLPLADIGTLEAELTANPGARSAQKALAEHVTRLVHGEEAFLAALRITQILFGDSLLTDLLPADSMLIQTAGPVTKGSEGMFLVEALVETGLATSKREARTFIESGAVMVNGVKNLTLDYQLFKSGDGELIHLKRGKKNAAFLQLQ
jgi:tyrosyl-tRNA synthetase